MTFESRQGTGGFLIRRQSGKKWDDVPLKCSNVSRYGGFSSPVAQAFSDTRSYDSGAIREGLRKNLIQT